jgi:hypothetical protein
MRIGKMLNMKVEHVQHFLNACNSTKLLMLEALVEVCYAFVRSTMQSILSLCCSCLRIYLDLF